MAFSTVASYDDAGRACIRNYYLSGDTVNPILYSLIFGLLISWLFQRGFKPISKVQTLNVIPAGAAVFDMLENIFIVTMLSVHPEQPKITAWPSRAVRWPRRSSYMRAFCWCRLVWPKQQSTSSASSDERSPET